MAAIQKTINDKWKKFTAREKVFAGGMVFLLFVVIVMAVGKDDVIVDAEDEAAPAVSVVVSLAKQMEFERTVAVQGNIESKNYADVAPKMPGVIEKIYVDEGDVVVEGKTLLFETDSLKIEKALEISKKDVEVAAAGLKQARASLELTKADYDKAKLDYDRFERLHEKKVVTDNEYENQVSRFKQSTAAKKLASAQVELASSQLEQARTALAIAKRDLADTKTYAALTGRVSMRYMEPGEMGGPGEPIVRIEDVNTVQISAYLPSNLYSAVEVGKTKMKIKVFDAEAGEFAVTYKSATIDPKMRTFEVKALVENAGVNIVPGAMAHIEVIISSRAGVGVPKKAIVTGAGSGHIFTVAGDIVQMHEVLAGLEKDGFVEIVKPVIQPGSSVVTMGQYELENGSKVSVQQEGAN